MISSSSLVQMSAETAFVGLVLVTWATSSFYANADANVTTVSSPSRPFPAILIFGDSTVDTGNNNYLPALFRANHLPYGIDSPGYVASGRFSNGKLISDMVAARFHIKDMVPPFLQPFLPAHELLTGVCFASSGSGYDDQTSVHTMAIPVSKQTEMLINYIAKLKSSVGDTKAKEIINNALVLVSAGPNDFIFNYYQNPLTRRHTEFSDISGYQDFILIKLQNVVQELYNLGCRKIVVAGLPVVGCLPIQMTFGHKIFKNRTCVEEQSTDSALYNQKLQKLLPMLQDSLPGSGILYFDVYNPMVDILQHPSNYGFEETKKGCCGTGYLETTFVCNAYSKTCRNHSEYLFWDSIHPTEAAAIYYSKIAESKIRKKFLAT